MNPTPAAPPMNPTPTDPRIDQPDDFYAALLAAHRQLTDAQSHAFNARLVLLLAAQVGRISTLKAALAAAAAAGDDAAAPRENPSGDPSTPRKGDDR